MDYDLDNKQDCARFQINLMLAEIENTIRDGMQIVYKEDIPREALVALLNLKRALREVDRVTQPGYTQTAKDAALALLGR